MKDREPGGQDNNETFRRLRRAYLIALGLIALAVLTEQLLVGSFLNDQRQDAEIINVAGRQRMLSQRIVKEIATRGARTQVLSEEWKSRHEWLKDRVADPGLRARLSNLDPLIAQVPTADLQRADGLSERFLTEMDAIVGDISDAAAAKVARLQRTKTWLGLATLAILLLELLLLFRPVARFVTDRLQELRRRERAQNDAKLAAERAVQARESSLRELHALNEAVDEAVLFATLRRDGTPLHVSSQLAKIIGYWDDSSPTPLVHQLHPDGNIRRRYADTLTDARAESWRGEWAVVDATGAERWWYVTIVPARRAGSDTELFFLANDITGQKADREELDRISRERIAEEVERGRSRSRQISTAQETERLRIARDLHDGIGQKLTALKFGLESINLPEDSSVFPTVVRLRDLAREIILSIRVATFNLSPPELSDYGLVVALEKLCRELSRLTGERILFENDGFTARLPPDREVNIYRIVQEAVNNAIKYARANYILVRLSPGDDLFSITVTDDGEGFAPEDQVEEVPQSGGGLGMRHMASRVEDLNGRMFVRSDPETGTKITINLPIEEKL